MAKRRLKKVPKAADLTHAAERLRKALVKRTKDELVNVVELAREDHKLLRRLDARFELETPPKELLAATRQAIADATDFDEREINYNFDYDYEAYTEVKRNLSRLIDQGHLRQAMELSLELMKEGSHQVEMSDEGLMTEDIEACLQVVVSALRKSDLPPAEIVAWCKAMTKADSVGFIYDREIAALQKHADASQS
jgi:regulator of sigma D